MIIPTLVGVADSSLQSLDIMRTTKQRREIDKGQHDILLGW